MDRIAAARLTTADRYPIIPSSTPPPPPTFHISPQGQLFPSQQTVQMPPKNITPNLCKVLQPQQPQNLDPALARDRKLALNVIQARWTHQRIAKESKIKDAPP